MVIDIISIAIIICCLIAGIKKGFVKALFGTVSFILAIILTFFFLDGAFSYISKSNFGKVVYDKTSVNIVEVQESQENETFFDKMIDKKGLMEKAEEAQKSLSEEIGDTTLKIITAVILFIGFTIVLWLLSHILNVFAKLPVIKTVNKLGGFIAGGINAYILLTIFSFVTVFAAASGISGAVSEQMEQSKIVSWFYLNNPLL